MENQYDTQNEANGGLRERKHREGPKAHEKQETTKEEQKKPQKTYGRTPDGKTFIVPQTHDMVSQLFSPSQPKNVSDVLVVALLGILILTLILLPPSWRVPTFAVIFLFWRACYNAGIGYLLHLQSKHWRLVNWAKQSRIFVDPTKEENPHPILHRWLKRELETKIVEDYRFEDAPIEYNTWLVFRRVCDVILLCDFVSYCLFAVACGGRPEGENVLMTAARWSVGLGLFFFNLWVKLDAHRVVKDFAWYWGDFFFLIDQELTFDGVFEMAPHPMYSIGYAGYYGYSLMAASYRVLIISIIAHAAQFAFLIWVENPHIDKTYNAPPPKKRSSVPNVNADIDADSVQESPETSQELSPPAVDANPPTSVHNLLGLGNTDLHRVTDSSIILLQILMFALATLTPSTPLFQALFVANAAIWRLWYSLGIGYILNRQSTKRRWTRHFLKYGGSKEEAWREWKGIYHITMTMCYASFAAASWKMYQRPANWKQGLPIFKHVIGASLIALQSWTVMSIYQSLGEYGWFFGDFFFLDQRPKLTYSGIYRYLNNPERVIGLAGVWGAALITSSPAIFCLALLSHVLTLAFIHFVERPHMEKLYGRDLREESGITRSLKRSLPPQLRSWQGSMDKMLEDTLESVEDFVDAARPKFAKGMSIFVKDTNALFHYPARVSITRLSPDLAGFDPRDYSLELTGAKTSSGVGSGQRYSSKALKFDYGTPIRLKLTAPLNHSKKDWVGLYMVADNTSRDVTRVSSQGRWVATNKNEYNSRVVDQGILVSDNRVSGTKRKDGEDKDFLSGELEFSGDKLWWVTGVFEFRYHHNGKHNVMAISSPFEIAINTFDEDDVVTNDAASIKGAVEQELLPLVRNCFDRDPDIAPTTVEESWGGSVERDGKYAKRVVYAMRQMFGIEFAPEVVQADGNVRNLAWRLCHAKKALVSLQFGSLNAPSPSTNVVLTSNNTPPYLEDATRLRNQSIDHGGYTWVHMGGTLHSKIPLFLSIMSL
ncbi:phosphatidylethanolamine N-methyltransferase [Bacidia gigantensis]|uniref:phosphatidylethanolamine N-methyltransferase n=1 Tax=Bacidia gigantensis TaxID=2732470 RepID=UPI001D03985B|nr:phosphatidylethanolamine N-methyltransferase [Bacidia gigantensis]KAG8527400.1 phosphatidylethanolamine N-methyltransferase [Bacidia gigantensis]